MAKKIEKESANAESIKGLKIVLAKLKELKYPENHPSIVAVKKQLDCLK